MIKRVYMRAGYQRAAAGVMSCLLMGSTLGLPLQRREPVAVPEESPSVGVDVFSHAVESFVDGARVGEDEAYLAVRSDARSRFTTAGATKPRTYAYTVQKGDSLWAIAESLGTDLPTLVSLNPAIDPDLLQPGQVLQVIDDFHGLAYTVQGGDSLEQVASVYGIAPGRVKTINGLDAKSALVEGQTLFLPGARPRSRTLLASRGGSGRERAAAPAPAAIQETESVHATAHNGLVWPITGGLLSSEFGSRWGSFHSGIDIAVPSGTRAVAAQAGTVVFSGWDGGYGYCVIIDHGDGIKTRYAHASALLVATGQTVQQGAPVIQVGSTGNATGPHLHFEILINGVAQNPRNFLP